MNKAEKTEWSPLGATLHKQHDQYADVGEWVADGFACSYVEKKLWVWMLNTFTVKTTQKYRTNRPASI